MLEWMMLLQATIAAPPPSVLPSVDLRCGAVLADRIATGTGMEVPGLLIGLAYFVGRIEATTPGIDAAAAIEATRTAPGAKAMMEADAMRCAREMDTVFDRLSRTPAKTR